MFLSTSSTDRCLRLWDIRTPRETVKEFPSASKEFPVGGFAVGCGGRFLARIEGPKINLVDLQSGKQLASYSTPAPAPRAIQFFPESLHLALVRPGKISLMDLQFAKAPAHQLPLKELDTPRFLRIDASSGRFFFVDGVSLCEASLVDSDV
ncbi:hypothetical protein L596_014919 [Steinernema carpocapsae]|nr:hypothetical protein L596_014919 [Steinernema carpocapsae]